MTRILRWPTRPFAAALRDGHGTGQRFRADLQSGRSAARRLLAAGPQIGRRTGQRLARRELAEVGFWQRILNWLNRHVSGPDTVVPHGWFGLVVLALLVVAAVVIVAYRVRPGVSRRSASGSVLASQDRTAEDYRRAAEQAALAGDYDTAIVEGVRAIATELDERRVLPPRPGRTADELAFEAGRELPDLAAELRAVTTLFDDVLYGDKGGTSAGYELVRQLDARVRAAKPTAHSAAPDPAGLAAPR